MTDDSSKTTSPAPLPPRRTTWTLKQNLARVVWGTVGRVLWVVLPPMRASLIRVFGGRVGANCVFARDVDIIIPWNLDIGPNVEVGSRVTLYSLGKITIGRDTVLDDKAHLCAGTHDFNDPLFPLISPPITIGERCVIGIDAYIGPGVVLGDGCRIWPRASVYKSFAASTELRGNPARTIEASDAS
jgi:putative colanic acid biosynthesis acetyltransferase WcaF